MVIYMTTKIYSIQGCDDIEYTCKYFKPETFKEYQSQFHIFNNDEAMSCSNILLFNNVPININREIFKLKILW